MGIRENIIVFKEQLPSKVKVVAVSKTKSPEEILEAYHTGHRIFGENRVQELVQKAEILPPDIEWHMVGHLQTNKVKYIVPFVSLIHSVDSMKLLTTINKEAEKNGRIQDCLLQIHIAMEETKFGLSEQELKDILNSPQFAEQKNIRICGLMGMATFTDDEKVIRNEFKYLAKVFHQTKSHYFIQHNYFSVLSMGMSGDYSIAIEEGSTMIRIGTIIFGEREGPNRQS
ncbi:MAG: alanine racemase [Bacteroides sp. SM23_62_1]|nr:MAG: alanine racemase [Bacteroides sp. SM23_62_1]